MKQLNRRNFQHDTREGSTSVDFCLDYDVIADEMIITNLRLHSNYESGLPRHPSIEGNPETRQKQLCGKYKRLEKNEKGENIEIDIIEWVDSPLAKAIQDKIFEIAEEERPKFF